MPSLVQRFFEPKAESVGRARDLVAATLVAWGLTRRIDDVRLCVSELACNALAHAAGPGFLVRLTAEDGFVRVEVHDASARQPRVQHPTTDDTAGRGLLIVEEVSDEWGVDDREPFGKVVWSRFRVEAPDPKA